MLKIWFMSIVAASMIVACADTLLAKSSQRPVGRLAGAMLILVVVMGPMLSLGGTDIGGLTEEMMSHMELQEQKLEAGSDEILRSIIEERVETYIVDKADELGASCYASVQCVRRDDGIWIPERVSVTGTLTIAQQNQLKRYIENELGIGPDMQTYVGGDPLAG
ncbi:MAG: hypothetical protein IJP02_01580 [Oscillospiraceae bacterium]|nr:hypothetical protein [Oscillospiraceae bacterium]